MTLSADDVEKAAKALHNAEKTRTQTGLLTGIHPEMTMEDAYRVQDALVARKRADGLAISGWKIGLTSKAMQDALNIDIPDSGVLFDNMHFDDSSTVPAGRFIQPRIEAEIAFVMKKPLDGAASREEVLAATEYVAPSIEILDTRIVRKDPKTGQIRKIFDTIADNAANAGIVLGKQHHDPDSVDLRWIGAIASKNNIVEETGLGAGVLNDPVMGIVWLSERLQQYGQTIRAGDVVLSGSFIRPIEAESGDHFYADFGPFGEVSIAFE